jgi:Uma2 family endonuclease
MTVRVTPVPPSFLSRALYRKVTVDEYHQMLKDGTFEDGDPIELLEGYLVQKMGHNPPHSGTVTRLTKRLVRLAPPGWEVRCQVPITLPDSEPEPDGLLAKGDEATFDVRHPLPADIGLVVEVADSSRYTDRREKGRIYARAGLPVYWIVNLVDRVVEVYTDPDTAADPPAYRTRTDYAPGAAVPVVLDGATVAVLPVAEIIP